MAWSPVDLAKGAYGAAKDTFSGESVSAYEPDKANFEYGGAKEDFFQGKADWAHGRDAPQADYQYALGARDQGQQSRAGISDQMARYDQMLADPNSSLAQQQLKQAQASNFRQQMSMARAGGGGAASLRAAQFQGGQMGVQATGQAAALRSQETQAALQAQSQLAMQQRAFDLQQQGVDAQMAQFQAQMELGSRGMNDQYALGMYGLGQKSSMAQLQGTMGYEGLRSGNIMGAQAANAQMDAQRDASLLGLAGTAGAAGLAASDVRAKEEIAPIGPQPVRVMYMPATRSAPAESEAEKQERRRESEARKRKDIAEDFAQGTNQALSGLRNLDVERYMPRWEAPDVMSDQQSKEQVRELREKNSALESAYAAVTGGKPDKLQRMPVPSRSYANEAEFHAAAAREYGANQRALEAERKQQIAYAMQQEEQRKDATAMRGLAEYERDRMLQSDAQRQAPAFDQSGDGPAKFVFTTPQPTLSDRKSKEYISALETALDNVRDEQVGGIRGAPTRRFDDVPPAVQAQASIPAYSFKYREPFASQHGGERRVGVMAQDLERNPLYASSVKTGPDGYKRVDSGQATMANIAADAEMARIVSDQERRLRAVERMPPFAKPRGF